MPSESEPRITLWALYPCHERGTTFSVLSDRRKVTLAGRRECRTCGQLYEVRVWNRVGEWQVGWRRLTVIPDREEVVTQGFA